MPLEYRMKIILPLWNKEATSGKGTQKELSCNKHVPRSGSLLDSASGGLRGYVLGKGLFGIINQLTWKEELWQLPWLGQPQRRTLPGMGLNVPDSRSLTHVSIKGFGMCGGDWAVIQACRGEFRQDGSWPRWAEGIVGWKMGWEEGNPSVTSCLCRVEPGTPVLWYAHLNPQSRGQLQEAVDDSGRSSSLKSPVHECLPQQAFFHTCSPSTQT